MSFRNFVWLAAAASMLSGCAVADFTFRPFVGDAQVQVGEGGARDVMDGVEIWLKGTPPKPYRVVGYLTSDYREGAGMASLEKAIAQKVKAAGGDGVILTEQRREKGDGYVMGRYIVYDTEITDEFEVFRYEASQSVRE